MRIAFALVSIGAVACSGASPSDAPTQTSRVTPTVKYGRDLGTFTLRVDPASGTVTQVGATGRGIHAPSNLVQNGNPLSNPPGTFQLVTTDAIIGDGMNGCPATDNCFTIRADSFLSHTALEVTLVAESVQPPRPVSNDDGPPAGSGLTSTFGMIQFGDIVAGGSSTREMRFAIPNSDPYTVVYRLYESAADFTVTSFDTGWFNSDGDHGAGNTNYFTGSFSPPQQLRSFFAFDLTGRVGTVNSVVFVPNSYECASPNANFQVFDVSTPFADLAVDQTGRLDIFADLGTGVELGNQDYTGSGASGNPCSVPVAVTFNAAGIAAVQAALGGQFAVGGNLGDGSSNAYLFGFSGDLLGADATLLVSVD